MSAVPTESTCSGQCTHLLVSVGGLTDAEREAKIAVIKEELSEPLMYHCHPTGRFTITQSETTFAGIMNTIAGIMNDIATGPCGVKQLQSALIWVQENVNFPAPTAEQLSVSFPIPIGNATECVLMSRGCQRFCTSTCSPPMHRAAKEGSIVSQRMGQAPIRISPKERSRLKVRDLGLSGPGRSDSDERFGGQRGPGAWAIAGADAFRVPFDCRIDLELKL